MKTNVSKNLTQDYVGFCSTVIGTACGIFSTESLPNCSHAHNENFFVLW